MAGDPEADKLLMQIVLFIFCAGNESFFVMMYLLSFLPHRKDLSIEGEA